MHDSVTVKRNAMSVDVEDWFQVQAFADVISRGEWNSLPQRVEANTDRLLETFATRAVRATFFTLGWVAERHPSLVRRIIAAGHELASHGYSHEPVYAIGQDRFRADIQRAKRAIEDAAGAAVVGYRAPTFSVSTRSTPWAHPILEEEGYRYSSSIFPIHHDAYGDAGAPRGPFWPQADGIVELPMTTVRLLRRNLPCSGGGWFRLLPYAIVRTALRRVNTVDGRPAVFYVHPWEVDPDQPRVKAAGRLARFRHYTGLYSTRRKLERVLQDFVWSRMDDVFAAEIHSSRPATPLQPAVVQMQELR